MTAELHMHVCKQMPAMEKNQNFKIAVRNTKLVKYLNPASLSLKWATERSYFGRPRFWAAFILSCRLAPTSW